MMTRDAMTGGPGLLAEPSDYRRPLLAWFDGNRRDLPWRAGRTPYGTWISEIMLQQTTVRTVVPYYTRFLDRFPDVAALAAASLEDVLSLWSGLGYYRRARHLHLAARMVVDDLGGSLPEDRAGWAALPGIGAYASGAIASMAYGEPVPALDANANRVLTRWAVAETEQLEHLSPASLRQLGQDLVDPVRPGDWNEALMELGALICTASRPACEACPMGALCRAGLAGNSERIPVTPQKEKTIPVIAAQLVVKWRDRILLLPPGHEGLLPGPVGGKAMRDDFTGLHQGLWSLPATAWYDGGGSGSDPAWPTDRWVKELARLPGLSGNISRGRLVAAGEFRHAITRYRIRSATFVIGLSGDEAPGPLFGGEEGMSHQAMGESTEPVLEPAAEANPGFFLSGDSWPPVSRLVTKGLSASGLTKG